MRIHPKAVATNYRFSLLYLLHFLCLLWLGQHSSVAFSQGWHPLKPYMDVKWFEQEFDENDREVVYTHCGEPTKTLRFYFTEDSSKLWLEFHGIHYEILDIVSGETASELRIRYLDEQAHPSVLILFFDEVMHYLLLNFQGVESAFIKEEDLHLFPTQDYCPK